MTLLVHSARQEAAVNGQYVAGDEARTVGGEKNGSSHKFLQLTEALHWRAHNEFPAALGAVQQLGIEFGAKYSGRDCVHTNSMLCPFNR